MKKLIFVLVFLILILPGCRNYNMEEALDDIDENELEDGWIFYCKTSDLASVKVIDGEFVVTVDKVPENHWEIELIKEKIQLKAGYIYVFSLDARADRERVFSFSIAGGEDKNWFSYGTSELIINTEMRTYFVIAIMPETITGRLTMSFGQDLGTVYIDNVQFKEFPASEAGNFPWIPPFPAGTTTGPELIQNGDFSDGAWNWKFKVRELAEATGQVIAGEFVATITTSSEENWHVSLSQDNITLEKGCSYILSFDARADHMRPIVVGAGLDPHYIGHWPPVIITTEMRTYFKLLYIPVTSDNWGFGFNLSEDTGDVYIDNVSLKKLSW